MFYHPDSPQSMSIKPTFTSLSSKYGDAIRFYTVDTNDHPVRSLVLNENGPDDEGDAYRISKLRRRS